MTRLTQAAVTLVVVVTLASPVAACPDCDAGRRAKAAIARDGVGANLAAVLLPFGLVGAAAFCAERFSWRWEGDGE